MKIFIDLSVYFAACLTCLTVFAAEEPIMLSSICISSSNVLLGNISGELVEDTASSVPDTMAFLSNKTLFECSYPVSYIARNDVALILNNGYLVDHPLVSRVKITFLNGWQMSVRTTQDRHSNKYLNLLLDKSQPNPLSHLTIHPTNFKKSQNLPSLLSFVIDASHQLEFDCHGDEGLVFDPLMSCYYLQKELTLVSDTTLPIGSIYGFQIGQNYCYFKIITASKVLCFSVASLLL